MMTTSTSPVAQRYAYSGMAICITMMTGLLWMPSQLGALSQGYQLNPRMLSHLAFAELFGFLLGTLFTSFRTVTELKRWVVIGCAVLIAANLTLLWFAPAVPFIVLRPLAGLASGIGFGYALKLCGGTAKPTRNFGLLTASMSLMMIIGFQFAAYLIQLHGATRGIADVDNIRNVAKIIFGAYAALAAVAAAVLLTNQPPPIKVPRSAQSGASEPLSLPVIFGLLAILLSFIGQGGIWAFLQTLGISHGFSVAGVANAMSVFAIMGIVGSLSAAILPSAVARSSAVAIALLVLWAGLYALYLPASLAWYIGGCAIGGFYWNFTLSLMLGLLAKVDPTGRGSVLGGTTSSTGSALGPLFAGFLIHGSNYQLVGWMTGSLCTAGVLLVWYVEQHSQAAQPLAHPV